MDIETIYKLHVEDGDVLIVELPKGTSHHALVEVMGQLEQRFRGRHVTLMIACEPVDIHRIPEPQMKTMIDSWCRRNKKQLTDVTGGINYAG